MVTINTALLERFLRRLKIILLFPKSIGNFFLDTLSCFIRSNYILGKPVNATIELTNLCDQRCPVCETGAGTLKRKKGSVSFSDYKKIIDKIAPFTNTVLLYYMGEPFLNREIYDIISYTKRKNIFTKICTNGQNIDAARLLDSGLDELQFQIGGVKQETHSVYRAGSNLSAVLNNVGSIVEEKKIRLKKGLPVRTKIYLGLIIMKHNEQEIKDFRMLADEIGVDGSRIEAPCVRNILQGNMFLPDNKDYWIYDSQAYKNGILMHKNHRPNFCRWMYYSITVTWEGDVIPCCRDVHGEHGMGNLLTGDLRKIWNGRKFREFRRTVLDGHKALPMCLLCDGLTYPSMENI